MTDRELLELLLKKVTGIENRIENIESNMVTKDYIEKVVSEQQEDVKVMLQHIDKRITDKTSQIETTLQKQTEIINTLSIRSIEQESEINVLKRTK